MVLFLAFGSNLGQKEENIRQSIQALNETSGLRLIQCSRFLETPPQGFQSNHLFLNAVARFETTLPLLTILETTQNVERKLGRTYKSFDKHYRDRTIDIDILFYGRQTFQSDLLTVPHPLLQNRLFVLEPLAEIAPRFCHPVLHKTILRLLHELNGKTKQENQFSTFEPARKKIT